MIARRNYSMTPYYENDNGKLFCGECVEIMPYLPPVDLTITSPPYDNIRDYNGYVFSFKKIAQGLYKITKPGGVVVWIVKDASIDGSETGTSFKQALYFKEIGFSLRTMLYVKNNGLRTGNPRFYQNRFEYVFILTKGEHTTFNPIKDVKNRYAGQINNSSSRQKDGSLKKFKAITFKIGQRDNVWRYNTGFMNSTKDKIAFKHLAIFPEALAHDHILTWSNEGDVIFDPMCGSGTVPKMCEKLNRKWLSCEISEEYCEIAAKRIENERKQLKLF